MPMLSRYSLQVFDDREEMHKQWPDPISSEDGNVVLLGDEVSVCSLGLRFASTFLGEELTLLNKWRAGW